MGLSGVKNELCMVKLGLLDPWDPRGPEIEDQGPWKMGLRKFFFFCFFEFCEKLAFFWGSKHPNLIIFEPLRPQKPSKLPQIRVGGHWVTPLCNLLWAKPVGPPWLFQFSLKQVWWKFINTKIWTSTPLPWPPGPC